MAFGKETDPKVGKQFSTDYQPKNRRKPSIITAAKRLMSSDTSFKLKGVNELDKDGNETGRKVDVSVNIKNEEGLALILLRKAQTDNRALFFLVEMLEGKAKATHTVNFSLEGFEQSRLNDTQRKTFIHLLEIGMGNKKNNQKLI